MSKKTTKQVKLTDLLKPKNKTSSETSSKTEHNEDICGQNIAPTSSTLNQLQSPSVSTSVSSSNIQNTGSATSPPADLTPTSSLDRLMSSQSLLSHTFPLTQFGKSARSFHLQWLDNFKWLEYSVSKDAAFCFPCRAFGAPGKFTIEGFTNWKKAMEKKNGFYQHEASTSHIKAASSWEEKRLRVDKDSDVTTLLTTEILKKRRFYVRNIIECIYFLVENELAFRGDWDIDEKREMGIFRNLFEFKLKDSEELRNCQNIMPKNCTYLSPDIQNELISVIARLIEQNIANEINSADVELFTILVDGTKDRKNKECVSMVARYVLNGKSLETLIGFETTDELNADSQAKMILKKIESCGLHTTRLLSQCYDGASVMSGINAGIQKIIQQILKRIIPYVHCFNHRLHLVIISALDGVYLAKIFFENVKVVYTFFHRSKVQSVYGGTAILKLIETRWAGHVRATNVIFANYTEILDTLTQVIDNKTRKFDGDDIVFAKGIKQTILSQNFRFMMVFMKEFLNFISPVDKILQSRDVGFREALPIINEVVATIKALRTPSDFDRILKCSEEVVPDAHTLSDSRPRRERRRPAGLSDFIITENIGERNTDEVELKSAFHSVIDIFISEMQRRFNDNSELLIAISDANDLCFDKLGPLAQIGIKIPSKEELVVAKAFIEKRREKHEKELARSGEKPSFKDRFNLLHELFEMKSAFPDVYQMIAAVDTFGSSTSVCECSFSALDRIGTSKRINMNNDRLKQLTFLAFEKKRLSNLPIDSVMKEFNKNPKRKLQLY